MFIEVYTLLDTRALTPDDKSKRSIITFPELRYVRKILLQHGKNETTNLIL